MKTTRAESLRPRKTPRQARSVATVEAIFQATIQVLLKEGPRRLTTTRVAERAGVSVGTMYQYFPHKRSLLYAVLQQHLDRVAGAVETACRQEQGQPVAAMVDGLVTAYIDAKSADTKASRALYLVAAELDTVDLIAHISTRIQDAATGLLLSASDAEFDDVPAITFTLRAAMAGATRIAFERGGSPDLLRMLRSQLVVMFQAYLREVATGKKRHSKLRARVVAGDPPVRDG